jgi:hypothetical protein
MTKLTAPNGYRIERVTDKNNKWRYYFICTTKVTDQHTGEQHECGFKYRADNRLKRSHICGQTKLDRYIIKPDSDKKGKKNDAFFQVCGTNVAQALFRFVSVTNISIKNVVQKGFRDLAQAILEAGRENPSLTVEQLMPLSSAKKFRKSFVTYESSIHDKYLRTFVGMASLVIDAGTVCGRSILNIIITNPLLECPPILFKGIRNFNGHTSDYQHELREAILDLKKRSITITGVNTDNLKAQVVMLEATTNRNKIMFQNDDVLKQIRRVSCQCHTMSLIINDLISKTDFGGDYDNIVRAVNFLRLKNVSNSFSTKCPRICTTRWRNLYCIFNWFQKNYSELICFINNWAIKTNFRFSPEIESLITIVFDVLPLTFPAFYLFDLLIRKLEADNCPFSNVILIYRAFLEILKTKIPQYSLNEGNPFLMDFFHYFDERVNSTADYRLLYLVSSFIPAGRQHLRNLMGVFDSELLDLLDQIPHDNDLFFNIPQNFETLMEKFKTDIVLNSISDKSAVMLLFENHSSSSSSVEQDSYLSSNSEDEDDSINQQNCAQDLNDNCDENLRNIQQNNEIKEEYFIDESTLHGRASLHRCEASLSSSDDEGMMDLVFENKPVYDIIDSTEDEHINNETEESDEENTNDDSDYNADIANMLLYDVHEQADPTVLINGNYNIHDLLNWCCEYLSTYAIDLNVDNPEELTGAYMDYIHVSTQALKITYNGSGHPLALWTYLSLMPRFRDLAKLVKRMIVWPASEAAAERVFALQKRIISEERSTTRTDLEMARIIGSYDAKNKIE